MSLQFHGFDWDQGNWPKCGNHGVSKSEIEELFSGVLSILPDPSHSSEETRFLGIGQISSDRWVFVAFTRRTDGERQLIRPISARYMHQKEVQHYAQSNETKTDP
ncbi:MAG: BrnT family toxin [Pseudomonadota bacterium]